MCERSIYLRDQADKCRWHARHIGDPQTQAELRKLANEYVVRAVELEGAGIAGSKPPQLEASSIPAQKARPRPLIDG
jgi:hypothetical protein